MRGDMPDVQTDYFAFRGGLVKTLQSLIVPPGSLLDAVNYEPDHNGGYRRGPAYERFDGRTRPSDAAYAAVKCTLTTTLSVGDALVVGGATCRFVKTVSGGMLVTLVSETISAGSTILRSGSSVGETNAAVSLAYSPAAAEEAQNRHDCANVARALIGAVPGYGDVRGVVMFGGTLYAWRDNNSQNACGMHKSTTSGWTAVALAEEVTFSNANANVGVGDTLTQTTITATIARVIVQTGTLASGTNTGKLVITGRAGGSFGAGAATTTGSGALTLGGAQVAQSFPIGGRYRFDQYNFYATGSTFRLYGCNGVGRAFEFDGTTIVFIDSGVSPDAPNHIVCSRNYLYLAHGPLVSNSSVGDPHRWVAGEGGDSKGIGADVTALFELPGEAVGITTRKSAHAIVGGSKATWTLQNIAPENGAMPDTVQVIGSAYALDDIGIIKVEPSQNYGNFNFNAESRLIQPIVDSMRDRAVASTTSRSANLYRVFLNDKRVLVGLPSKQMAFTTLRLAHQATCAWSGEDSAGAERTFFGANDGYVYELDRGSSFDGQEIEAFVRIWYWHAKSPRLLKRFRRMVLEMAVSLYSILRVQHTLDYGAAGVPQGASSELASSGAGGLWGNVNWGGFVWGAADVSQPSVDMNGSGANVATTVYSKSAIDLGHTMQGAIVHFTPRRTVRT